MNADKHRFETQHETGLAFHLRESVTCMDAQMPRAQDAQERLFICGQETI
jgi:formate-dependent nitrite reductase cytochrome c552 subunit